MPVFLAVATVRRNENGLGVAAKAYQGLTGQYLTIFCDKLNAVLTKAHNGLTKV